jgi:capsular exopolysaccharide synthesis family protein
VSGASRRWTAAIDSYRMLLMRSLGPESTTLMVTSASAGEGKTSLSSHLAVSVARSGRRTLLIDADLRKPTLHRLFGVPVSPGLTDVLCGATSPEDSVRATGVPNLWLLPAGDRVQSQYDPLTEDRTRDLLEQMRTSFETTIVDSSPVLLVADSLTLVQHVDGILLSIMRGVSQMPKISAALHRIKCLGRPVLGAVVHGTEEEVYGTEYLVSHTDEA